jgi:hypothetical protein
MSRRPTPTPRVAALGANRGLLVLTAVALGLGALAAACAPGAARQSLAQRTPAPQDEVDRVLRAAGATGPTRAVWVWNPRWVEGDPGAEPLLRALEWVAATGPATAPTGTVTVWQDPAADDAVAVAATGDDAELAAALAGVGPDETLVTDRSDWLVVSGDRVRPLLDGARTDLHAEVPVEEFRTLLVERQRESGRAGDTGGG